MIDRIIRKTAIDVYCTRPEATRSSYSETVKSFRRYYTEKAVTFRGQLACRVQEAHEKLKNFPGGITAIGAEGVPRRLLGYTGSLSASRFSRTDPT